MSIFGRLGIAHPIVQAPMAGTSTPALAAAVSNAGGLGSIAFGATNAAGARAMIEALRGLTSKPFNVNLFTHKPAVADAAVESGWLTALKPVFARYGAQPPTALRESYKSFADDEAMLALLLETKPAVASFHFGLPALSKIERLKAAGVIIFTSATNLSEAEKAVAAGADAVVAQGWEAGGHRGVFDPSTPDSKLGVAALTRLLASKISVPVIAAGGIMDGAGIASMLKLGAAGAQLGTAFVGCPESSADPFYRAALFSASAYATQMTASISGRPARCLANKFTALDDAELKGVQSPAYPICYDAGKALAQAAVAKGDGGFGAQWAGQGAPLARALKADDLMRALVDELQRATA